MSLISLVNFGARKMDQFVVAQILGFVSFALGILAFYQKDDKKLKIMMLIFNINHLVHFLLLGSIVSALSALLSTLRTATAIYVSSKIVAALFIIVGLASGLALAESLADMWSVVGMIIGTYAVFVLKGIQMRIAFLMGATCWLINNIIIGSIGGVCLEATLIVINSMTMWRLLRERREPIKCNAKADLHIQ